MKIKKNGQDQKLSNKFCLCFYLYNINKNMLFSLLMINSAVKKNKTRRNKNYKKHRNYRNNRNNDDDDTATKREAEEEFSISMILLLFIIFFIELSILVYAIRAIIKCSKTTKETTIHVIIALLFPLPYLVSLIGRDCAKGELFKVKKQS